jgi:DNA replication protein DnaC
MLNKELNKLAASLNLTENEQEPYLLTKEEEERAIDNAVIRAKQHAAWKMRRLLMSQEEIFIKLSEIDWTERIDKEGVLKLANTAKLQDQWNERQRDKRRQQESDRLNQLHEFWTYSRVFNLMKWNSENVFGKPFKQTAENLPVIKALCFFVSRNDRFMELGYDPLKGLLIRGPSGTGKTHLVRCIENNGINPILTQSMLEITERIKDYGEFKFELNGQKIIYLDDVGTEEPVVNFFGTKIAWFKNFIEGVYLKTKLFNHLIISSNLNFKGIEDQYGYRVASRMREMFNVVDLKGLDLRDKKNLKYDYPNLATKRQFNG